MLPNFHFFTALIKVDFTGLNHVAIEEHHSCFGLGGYFMAAVLAAASYSSIGFSLYFAVHERRVMVPGGSKFHLEPGTIHPCWNLTGT